MEPIDFSVVLASTVHDTKNSLTLLLQSLDEFIGEVEVLTPEQSRQCSVIHYEATRVNNDLIQLLALFKLEQSQLALQLNYHPVLDFLEDQMLRYSLLLDTKGIHHELDCDEVLTWYFDAELVSGVVNNVLANTIRYTRDKVVLRAFEEEGMLCIEVADNGRGYPEKMLSLQHADINSVNFSNGSTGLGLYFARQIAAKHVQDGRSGRIELANGGALGGGVFRLYLP
ncbi:MAG: HAMP domain-containing histidine kinase [Gammaproteobacteria bacterium]|nr:HAMP domain-containing histidine kinase [Gammaproteobacteria bacterium]